MVRCHLVVEDVSRTKRCSPLGNGRAERGMNLAQFKVFLGTLAQFHAVGIGWNDAKRDDSALVSCTQEKCDISLVGTLLKNLLHISVM